MLMQRIETRSQPCVVIKLQFAVYLRFCIADGDLYPDACLRYALISCVAVHCLSMLYPECVTVDHGIQACLLHFAAKPSQNRCNRIV